MNKLIISIIIIVSFANLSGYVGNYFIMQDYWNPKANGMGQSFLPGSEGYSSLFYNPSALSDIKNKEFGVSLYAKMGNTLIPPDNNEYGEYFKSEKVALGPYLKFTNAELAYNIYNNKAIKAGMGIGLQVYKDSKEYYKIQDTDYEYTGGDNRLSYGFGLSYQEKYKIGASYHNTFYSLEKNSMSSENEPLEETKDFSTGGFLLVSGSMQLNETTTAYLSYQTEQTLTNGGPASYAMRYPDRLFGGLKYSTPQYDLTIQSNYPYMCSVDYWFKEGIRLNSGLCLHRNEKTDFLGGIYYNEYYNDSDIHKKYTSVYGLTTGLVHKHSARIEHQLSADYSYSVSKMYYGSQFINLFKLYYGIRVMY